MDSTKEEKPCIFLRYPKIFWDNPKIASASPKELYAMVNRWRASDDPLEQLEFKDFLRRMVERGSLSDAHIFLKPEEVREFLLNEILYFMDERVEPLWKKFAELPDSFQVKTKLGGRHVSRDNFF